MRDNQTIQMTFNNQGTPKEKLIYYTAGFLLVLYFMILCGSAWVPDCTFTDWMNNFTQFVLVEHHFIVGFTRQTPMFIIVGESIWTLAYLYFITAIKHPFRGQEYGHAKWGEPAAFTQKYSDHNQKNLVKVNFGDLRDKEPQEPVYVNTHNYWLAEGVYLSIDNKYTSNLNLEIVGPPGTGKTFRVVRPILSQLAGNFLVTDPKGELSQQTGQYMEDNDYGVFVLNCQSEQQMWDSHHFNPFRYITCESDILGLCEILFKATTKPDANSSDQFFEDMAQVLLNGIFYLMHYTFEKQDKTWKKFVELLDSTAVKANPQTGAIDLSDPNCFMNQYSRANEKWKAEHNGEELKGFRDIEKIYSGAHETASSIVSSLDAHCKYMKLDCVVHLLSDDDIDFINTFGYCKRSKKSPSGKHILYLVTSESVRYFDWIPSMVYSLFIGKLYDLTGTDKSLHLTLPIHLTFLMDEFYNTTLPDSIVGLSSTMRSRGMNLIPIVQNFQQYKDKFPKNDQDKNFRSNMCTTIVLGGPDMDSCETLEKEFGKMTINKQTTGLTRGGQGSSSENEDVMEKPLFPANDIYQMNKDGPCAVKVKGTYPLWVTKVQFQNSPLLPLLTRQEPYKPKMDVLVKKIVIDHDKSPCEQFPDVMFGTDAVTFLQRCHDENVPVIEIADEELNAVAILDAHKNPIPGNDATTNEFWKNVSKATVRVLEEERKNALNLDLYSSEQVIVVQRLRNAGFEAKQINALDMLIRADYSFDEIVNLFGPHMPAYEIEEFAERFSKIKNKKFI